MSRHSHATGRAAGTSAGPSQRQLRVGELMRRTLAQVLARGEVHDPVLTGTSITVGEVVVSADLRRATAYVLPLGGEGREEVLAALNRNRAELRRQLSREVTLKFSPELHFAIDETFDRLDRSRRLFADPQVQRDVAAGDEDAPE